MVLLLQVPNAAGAGGSVSACPTPTLHSCVLSRPGGVRPGTAVCGWLAGRVHTTWDRRSTGVSSDLAGGGGARINRGLCVDRPGPPAPPNPTTPRGPRPGCRGPAGLMAGRSLKRTALRSICSTNLPSLASSVRLSFPCGDDDDGDSDRERGESNAPTRGTCLPAPISNNQ